MREVRFPDGRRALYTYDAFGRRVRKEIVPAIVVADLAKGKGPEVGVTEYLWDGNALAAELSSEHGARVHVHAPGTLVPMLQAEQGEVFAVVCDHLGMPKELLGQDGRVAWAAAHSAWGRVVEVKRAGNVAGARPLESPFRLLGQYADEETGLCYTRFRYFDPQHGRWMSPDPLGILGGLNLLAFDGCPTVDVDPLGLASNVGCSPTITAQDLTNKTAAELRALAQQKGLVPHPTNPNKFMDPVTNKQRIRIDQGHTDPVTGLPYDDSQAAVPHVHGYDEQNDPIRNPAVPDLKNPSLGNKHFPIR
jgi:RHS repeat-associated protein